ncbi:hypothetical protein ABW20_dc0105989 [Dactylellina cionopaga]|nr:hypothetical protein ABW20_dc0105989 [Dactylellina cionopaga]
MDNGGSITTGTLTTSIAVAATTTSKLYNTSTALASPSDNGGNHGPTVLATTIVFLALAFISVTLRVIARGFIARKMRIDDHLILVAFALSFGMCLSIVQGVNYGFGRHSNTIPYSMALEKQKYQYAFTLLFNPAIAVTKVSILAFYLLVFKVQKHFRRFCWITMAVVIVAGLALTLLLAFRCSPIGLVFDPESNRQPFPGCIGTVRIYFASAPVNILEDLAIIVLPIPVLTSLRLPNRQKAILLVVFSLGVFDIVVGLIRIHYFQLTQSQALDFDYNAAYSFMWAAIEVNVGIVCASIPMTKPLISRFFPGWLGTTSLSDGHRENTHYEPTYAYGGGTPTIPIARRGTIGSTSHRPSIGVGWLSAYGDSRGQIGELGHVDNNGQIQSPTRGRRERHPSSRLEATLWQDNNIFIKTPPGTLSRIPERQRDRVYGSIEDSGLSGSTAVARPSEASSYLEYFPTLGKSQTPPWEKMELEEIDPLDSRDMARPGQPNGAQRDSNDIPPWEKLELPGLDDPNLMGFTSPFETKTLEKSPGGTSSTLHEGKKRQTRKTSASSTGSSTRAPSTIFGIGRSRSKSKPESLSLEIPHRPSSQIPKIIEPGSRKASQDTDVSPTDKRLSIKSGPEPILPLPPPGLDTPTISTDHLTPAERLSKSGPSSASTGEAPLGARKEQIDVAELANEKEVVEPPDATEAPRSETPPWEKMHFEDVSGKGKAYSSPSSSSPEESRSQIPPPVSRTRSAESSSLLRDALAREQYDKIGSIIDPSTPVSEIVTPAWAKEDDLRGDEGNTPPAIIGSRGGMHRVVGTPARERKLRDYFGEQNIGALVDLAPALGAGSGSSGSSEEKGKNS